MKADCIDAPEDLERVVVAIDPAVTSKKTSDETGIIVAGKDSEGKFYVLNDSSARYTPSAWSEKAIMLYNQYECDKIIAEVNNGGQLVEHTLRTQSENVPYKSVHASHVENVQEQNQLHHFMNKARYIMLVILKD
jgi:phage terminase large subunit-like protein